MPTNGTPPPTWPIQPTTLYQVAYYPNNASNTAPTYIDPIMYEYEAAVARAKDLITTNTNTGVCTITIVNATIVYPSIPWQDF